MLGTQNLLGKGSSRVFYRFLFNGGRMRKLVISIGLIGTICLLMGLYLFPFGQDLFLGFLTDLGGGDYNTGVLYAYIITGAMVIIGLFLTKAKILTYFGHPVISLGFIIVLMALGYVVFSALSGTW